MATRREVLEIAGFLGLAGLVGLPRTAHAAAPADAPRTARMRLLLGGMVRVTVAGHDTVAAAAACEAALDTIESVEQELSLYLPSSALSRLNRDGHLANPPAHLVRCLGRAVELAALTGGAFDPTVEPLLETVRASFEKSGAAPANDALAAAATRVDYRRVHVGTKEIRLDPGTRVTLNGIGKGYAMDRARETLEALGVTQVLVAASGDMAVGPGAWKVALRDPRDIEAVVERAPWNPPAGGVGSSGSSMNAFTVDRSWHHIADPRTGHSPTHFAGVTVHAKNATDADALSTALFVLAEKDALALADKTGVALLATRADGSTVRSASAQTAQL